MKKKYLIYTDILGFEKLPKKIAEETGFGEDSIRENYLTGPLRQKIEKIERTGVKVSRGKSEIERGSDNYLLMV